MTTKKVSLAKEFLANSAHEIFDGRMQTGSKITTKRWHAKNGNRSTLRLTAAYPEVLVEILDSNGVVASKACQTLSEAALFIAESEEDWMERNNESSANA